MGAPSQESPLFPMPFRRSSRAAVHAAMVVVAIASPVFLARTATAQERPGWSQFQAGPGHEGVLANGPQPPYRVRWTLPAPAGDALSGAVVTGDVIVSVGEEAVYGIDIASGVVAWQVPRSGGPLSVPAIGGGQGSRILVYLEGPGPSDASASPSPSAGASPSTAAASASASASPTTGDEGGDVSMLVAVAMDDRSELWRTPLGAISRSGVTIDGATAFVGDQDGTVYAVSLDDGTITWSGTVDGRVDTPLAASQGQVYAVARNIDTPQISIAAFDAATGERAWPAVAVQASSTAGSAPAAGGGSVYVGSADRRIQALAAADGTERWGTLALSVFSPATSLALGEGSVFAADIGGGLYRLDVADGQRRWSYHFNEVVFRSSPVVSGSSVLLGLGDGRLVAVDVSSGHLVWQSAPTPGLIGTIALSPDAVIAVKGGKDAGLIAFEHDPEGALIDVPSPTELDAGTTLSRYALAATIVFTAAFVPGLWAKRRFAPLTAGPAGAGEARLDDEDEEHA